MNRTAVITFVFLTLGLIKYFYHLPSSMFEADQEYLALSGKAILGGDFALIGAPTSVGGMFIGPLYNYVVAGALRLFQGNPLVVNGLSFLWASLSIPGFYLVGRHFVSERAGFIAALVALFSFDFMNHVQVPPLLFPLPLITLLVIAVAESAMTKRKKALLLGSLAGLSLHFHFSGIFFLPLLLWYGFWWIVPFSIFLLPILLFEIRNGGVMTRNTMAFLASSVGVGTAVGIRLDTFLSGVADIVDISGVSMKVIAFALVIVSIRSAIPTIRRLIFAALLFFLLYRGQLLPYYAVIAWTATIVLIGEIASILWTRGRIVRIVSLALLMIFAVDNVSRWTQRKFPQGVGQKLSALQFIKSQADDRPIYLSRTIEVGRDFGFDYLASYAGIKHSGNLADPNYTIVLPARWQGIEPDYVFGDIGVVLPKTGSNEQ